ncbi:NASP-related protein sim3 [Lotus japonicus]|uniref:NASP-related protein sim3 n=1 Tax=Lotus japonicus TaxID=34305 RepID=UPI00258599F3|nr:NASP-related protein sim3 [Lotus japonicus]
MVEEAPASETSVSMAPSEEAVAVDGTLNPSEHGKSEITNGATVDSAAIGGAESASNAETSGKNSLELAVELMDKGTKAMKEDDFGEAAENFSRALEIRVANYGELAPECVNTYYKYGCALLYKAQEEADPLGDVPKKQEGSQHGSSKDESVKSTINAAESSTAASFSSNAEQDIASNDQESAVDDESTKNYQEEDDEDSDAEDTEADEDESDLDLAWKMLDIARAIVEKQCVNTIEHVDILSTLAEISLEREEFENSLSDYQKALSILEQLVEPDDRYIANLNFRICLCLEVDSKPEEAIAYCEKAASVCKARLDRLTNEVKSITPASEAKNKSIEDKQAEIETLTGLSSDLENKLEDLQLLVSNPKSTLSELLEKVAAKAGGGKESIPAKVSSSQLATANSSGGFDSPTISTAHSNGSAAGVTHLGVVGRGVKRTSLAPEASAPKKPALESTEGKGDSGSA